MNTSDKADVKSVEDGDSSLKRVQSLEEKAKEVVLQKPKGNTVSVTVYMESQCPDTTGFIKRQLVPTFEKLQSAERINFTIVPFGKAHCERKDDNYLLVSHFSLKIRFVKKYENIFLLKKVILLNLSQKFQKGKQE